MMEIFVIAIAFGVACAVIALNKNRSAFGWFILGFLFPLISLIVIACLSRAEPEKLGEDITTCPFCAEMIKKDAVVCRYCGRDLPKGGKAADPEAMPSDEKREVKAPAE